MNQYIGRKMQEQTTLLAIRHGETQWNAEERYQGHGDSPLTETGRNQIIALSLRMQKIQFDTLISSDLGRAQETAAIIANYTGHSVETDSRIRERNYGILEGLTVPEIKTNYSEILNELNMNNPDYIIPEGESHQQHYQRNALFIKELLSQKRGAKAALIIHGGVLDSIFRYVSGLPLDRPRCFTTNNASLSIITHGTFYGTVRWVIETWNDVGHLNGMGRNLGLG
jgi:probable phosphoglycerate mutase